MNTQIYNITTNSELKTQKKKVPYLRHWVLFGLVALISCGTTVNCVWAATSFQGLGDLPGGNIGSGASGISADGMVVVGSSSSAFGGEAFRWTLSGGMVGLGDLPGGDYISNAFAVSADGSVIVGNSRSGSGPEAFRWTAGGGMVGLGDLPGGTFISNSSGVSADGSVVVGTSSSALGTNAEAYRWTELGGMVALGSLFSGAFESGATDVSGDGSIVVGGSVDISGDSAFRWTSGEGMVMLDDPRLVFTPSVARAISSNGSVIVGRVSLGPFSAGSEAFIWTQDGGIVGLGRLSNNGVFNSSTAFDVSSDGSVIVGVSQSDLDQSAFIWDQALGMRDLNTVLINLGLDLTGWTLTAATGISDDGLTIVGTGINPNGDTEAFIATLPEPGTLAVIVLGIPALLGRRK